MATAQPTFGGSTDECEGAQAMRGGSLDYLKEFGFEHPHADLWNAMLEEVLWRFPIVLGGTGDGRALPHPWQTTIARWEPEAGQAVLSDPSRAWRVDVLPGCVNGGPGAALYALKDDPRGWVKPDDYKGGIATSNAAQILRPLHEPDDAPFLTLETPAPASDFRQAYGIFAPVTDGARPPFFRAPEMWERSVMRAWVTVALRMPALPTIDLTAVDLANPLSVTEPLVATVAPYQVRVQRPVPLNFNQPVVNYPLAELFLTRSEDGKPENDEFYVRQLEYWDLAGFAFLDDAGMTALGTLLASFGLVGGLVAEDILELLSNVRRIVAWSL